MVRWCYIVVMEIVVMLIIVMVIVFLLPSHCLPDSSTRMIKWCTWATLNTGTDTRSSTMQYYSTSLEWDADTMSSWTTFRNNSVLELCLCFCSLRFAIFCFVITPLSPPIFTMRLLYSQEQLCLYWDTAIIDCRTLEQLLTGGCVFVIQIKFKFSFRPPLVMSVCIELLHCVNSNFHSCLLPSTAHEQLVQLHPEVDDYRLYHAQVSHTITNITITTITWYRIQPMLYSLSGSLDGHISTSD